MTYQEFLSYMAQYEQDAYQSIYTGEQIDDAVGKSLAALPVDNTLSATGKAADAKKTGDELNDLKSALSALESFDDSVEIPFNLDGTGYIKISDGEVASSSASGHTDYIDIHNYKTISYKKRGFKGTTAVSSGVAFYDKNKTFISSVADSNGCPSDGYLEKLFSVEVPVDAVYFRATTFANTETRGNFAIYGETKIAKLNQDYSIQRNAETKKMSIILTSDITARGVFSSGNGASTVPIGWSRTTSNFVTLFKSIVPVHIKVTPASGKRVAIVEFSETPNYEDGSSNSSIFVGSVSGKASESIETDINPAHYYVVESNIYPISTNVTVIEIEYFVKSEFYNKKISIIGDSISSYTGLSPTGTGYASFYPTGAIVSRKQMWWDIVADYFDATILKVNANSGSCVTTVNSGRVPCSSDERTSALNDGDVLPDIVICECGLNDYYSNASLGTFDGSTVIPSDMTKFTNAYAYMLKKIQQNYPAAIVYCCTIAQHIHSGYQTIEDSLDTVSNSSGVLLTEYNDAIRSIARLFGCKIIDIENCGITLRNVYTFTQDTSPNGVHPNIAGHRLYAKQAIKDMS